MARYVPSILQITNIGSSVKLRAIPNYFQRAFQWRLSARAQWFAVIST